MTTTTNTAAITSTVIGTSPDRQTLYRWIESDGSKWQDVWQAAPGGGIVLPQRIG